MKEVDLMGDIRDRLIVEMMVGAGFGFRTGKLNPSGCNDYRSQRGGFSS